MRRPAADPPGRAPSGAGAVREIVLPPVGAVAAWRAEARALARAVVPTEAVVWRVGAAAGDLFAATATAHAPTAHAPTVPAQGGELWLPRAAVETLEAALSHSDPERFARAHGIVLRLTDGSLRWGDRSDAALRRLLAQARAVQRDIHKMHAFVRFRELPAEGPRRAFAAWFEPEHPILVTVHPSHMLRLPDESLRQAERARFRDDLAAAVRLLSASGGPPGAQPAG